MVTRRIGDIKQNILQFPFQTGSCSKSSYFHIFFLITFLKEAYIQNIIIILWINYIIIICINNKNVLINNNYGRLKDLSVICKIPMGMSKNFFKIYRQYGHAPLKSLPALVSQGFDKFCINMICSCTSIYIFLPPECFNVFCYWDLH